MSEPTDKQSRADPTVARDYVNFVWLVRLRWAAIAGHAVTIAAASRWLEIQLRVDLLSLVVIGEAVSNLIVWYGLRRRRWGDGEGETTLACILALDLLFLTALLFCSGGASNPLSVFYLVNISLAAAVLRGRWSWLLTSLAIACFASLFVTHIPVPELAHEALHETARVNHDHAQHGAAPPVESRRSSMRLHLQGMLLAFAGAAAFVAYFVGRVRRELDERERELADEQRRRAQAEKLESLATLAAGAAHELATPLATIAVVARELELRCAELDDSELGEDVRVIERETARCRAILGSLAGRAGELRGESWENRSVEELLKEARDATSHPESIEVTLNSELAALHLRVPRGVLAQTIQCLLQNAIDASAPRQTVRVAAERNSEMLEIAVDDQGCGMPPHVLHRLGEPFFTTKEAGRGLGLGVFVARRVIEQWGGALEFSSRPGAGTIARLRLPLSSWLAKPQ